jgi:cytochrome c
VTPGRVRLARRNAALAAALAAAAAVAALGIGGVIAGCGGDAATAPAVPGGDPERGELAIRRYGCGTCHEIPSVRGADGHVGPSLAELADRHYLAGRLPNTPDHLIEWIRHPQSVEPGNVMPDMAVPAGDAADIAAALYRR